MQFDSPCYYCCRRYCHCYRFCWFQISRLSSLLLSLFSLFFHLSSLVSVSSLISFLSPLFCLLSCLFSPLSPLCLYFSLLLSLLSRPSSPFFLFVSSFRLELPRCTLAMFPSHAPFVCCDMCRRTLFIASGRHHGVCALSFMCCWPRCCKDTCMSHRLSSQAAFWRSTHFKSRAVVRSWNSNMNLNWQHDGSQSWE